MSRLCRGRITAIVLLICAATFAAAQSSRAEQSPEAIASAVSPTSPEISGDDLLSLPSDEQAIDVDWMIRDTRVLIPQGSSLIDHAPVATESLHTGSLSSSRTSLPIDPPAVSENPTGNVNDMLVPVPVVSVGSAVLMSAILFYLGGRMLRMHRRIQG